MLIHNRIECSLLGGRFLASLGSLAGGSGCLTGGASLSEDLAALLGLVPVEVLLELAHGHLVGGLGGLLTAWRWHGGGSLLATNALLSGLLSSRGGRGSTSLLGGLLLSGLGLAGSVLNNLIDALSNVSTGGSLLALLGSSLRGGLLGTLSTSLNLGDGGSLGLNGILSLLLDEDVLEGEDGGGALLEAEVGEVITLAGTNLDDALDLTLGGGLDSGEVGKRLSLGLVGGSLLIKNVV